MKKQRDRIDIDLVRKELGIRPPPDEDSHLRGTLQMIAGSTIGVLLVTALYCYLFPELMSR